MPQRSILCLALCSLAIGQLGKAHAGTFDVPGAGIGRRQGTLAYSINSAGAVAGYYVDAKNVRHGYVRDPSGAITTFDPPGSQGTFATSINTAGAITGQYSVATLSHGFVRDPTGAFTSFDIAGAGAALYSESINDSGTVAGYYSDARNVSHGFVRAPSGTIATFDAPGATDTYATSVNSAGTVTGYYFDMYHYHGFVRDSSGSIATFDAPGAVDTYAIVINAAGDIAGDYFGTDQKWHGFARTPSGGFTEFDDSWADLHVTGINSAGGTTGYGDILNGHISRPASFVRSALGAIQAFSVPDALTYAFSVNDAGAVTGYCIDSSNVYHGFLATFRVP